MNLLTVAGLVSAVITAAAAASLLRRPDAVISVVVGVASASLWSFGGVIAGLGSARGASIGVSLVLMASSGVLYAFACHARDLLVEKGHRRFGYWPLLEPLVIGSLVVTDPWFHLLVAKVQIDPLRVAGGPSMALHAIYGFGVVILATLLHVKVAHADLRRARGQLVVSTLSVMVPTFGAFTTVYLAPTGTADYTGATMGLTVAVWWWVERRALGLPSLAITTAQTLQALPDGVVVSDAHERIVGANEAAIAMLDAQGSVGRQVVGLTWSQVVDSRLVDRMRKVDHEVLHGVDGHTIDVRITSLATPDGHRQGEVVVLRDITEVEQLRSELAEQTIRDGLTGLHNRRHLDNVLQPLVDEAWSQGTPLSAVMVDLDHFKNVNDTYGHAAGDEVLVAVAAQLARCFRTDDVLVRFGGEEFLALLPGTAVDIAAARAHECRRKVADLRIEADSDLIKVTLSVGVAVLSSDSDTLLREVDNALYDAKLAGRDRVAVAGRSRE